MYSTENENKARQEYKKEMSMSTRSLMPNYDNPNRKYCVCDRPSFDPMIACGSGKCQLEWFRFGYLQILKEPKGEWFCIDCRRKTDQ